MLKNVTKLKETNHYIIHFIAIIIEILLLFGDAVEYVASNWISMTSSNDYWMYIGYTNNIQIKLHTVVYQYYLQYCCCTVVFVVDPTMKHIFLLACLNFEIEQT